MMMMEQFLPDILIGVFIVISIAISLVRGFVKELISLISWALAAWLAVRFSHVLAQQITFTDVQPLRIFLAFLTVFVTVIFVGAMVNFLIGQMVHHTPFRGADKALGVAFGLTRGIVVVSVLVLLGGLTSFPKDKWWTQSRSIPHFQKVATWMQGYLPADASKHFSFGTEKAKPAEVKPVAPASVPASAPVVPAQ